MSKINFRAIEKKWQKRWFQGRIFQAKESRKKKYYVLEMYPYPSSSGLHMGHAFNYIVGDIQARYMKMNGFNVLHPMGFDSFGLPAENAAIKAKSHPRKFTDEAIKNFTKQQKALGLSYDWSRKIQSHDIEYYKWNQWIFLQMYKKGLVYRKNAWVNWDPVDKTVLANEQVINGKAWRSGAVVEQKQIEQWFIKTTAYAEELLKDIEKLNWPERIKVMQRNWIGKSEGTEIDFEINNKPWKIFTTRPDTIYGVTFMVISAQHENLMSLVTEKQKKQVNELLKKIKSTKQEDMDVLEKEGAFTGSYAEHPLTREKIPIYVGNFVLADYGSGMVMAVPAHDQRDFEFAKKYQIPIKIVINPKNYGTTPEKMTEAYTDFGVLINSDKFNGLDSKKAKEEITKFLQKKKLGKKKFQYKLRDWLVSRQRYWGTPIPMLYDNSGKVIPVDEKELPVKLPEDVKFGKGNPLETSKSFLNVRKDGKIYRRETDTMDTFFDSSWYYLRFCDSGNKKTAFDKKKTEYWMPVDFYTGGAEHAVLHLIYARFFTKVFRDLGLLNINEPFPRLFNQGMIHGEDGAVMSKSRGNVIDPLKIIEKYNADSLRMFLISMASPDKDLQWNSAGLESVYKFLKKVSEFFTEVKIGKSDARVQSKINKTIKDVTENIENLRYNLAVIQIRELFDYLNGKTISKKDLESSLKILSPICPHLSEELWEKIKGKGFISAADWPKADVKKINEKFEQEEKLIDNLVNDIMNILRILQQRGEKKENVKIFAIPNEFEIYNNGIEEIKKRVNLNVEILSVKDAKNLGKTIKSKPGKPGIFLE